MYQNLNPQGQPQKKIYVDGVQVTVLNERVQIFDQHGNLITQSLKDYTKQRVNAEFKSLDGFLAKMEQS